MPGQIRHHLFIKHVCVEVCMCHLIKIVSDVWLNTEGSVPATHLMTEYWFEQLNMWRVSSTQEAWRCLLFRYEHNVRHNWPSDTGLSMLYGWVYHKYGFIHSGMSGQWDQWVQTARSGRPSSSSVSLRALSMRFCSTLCMQLNGSKWTQHLEPLSNNMLVISSFIPVVSQWIHSPLLCQWWVPWWSYNGGCHQMGYERTQPKHNLAAVFYHQLIGTWQL